MGVRLNLINHRRNRMSNSGSPDAENDAQHGYFAISERGNAKGVDAVECTS